MIDSREDLEPDDNESMPTLVSNQSSETANQAREIADLKNQLDESKTRLMIIETTKQDEIDELKFRSKQEIDSLNHIIDALQNDLNMLRNDYDLLKNNFKELKKQSEKSLHHHHHHINTSTSPISTKTSVSTNSPALNSQQIENENLEEDMRKAKESADMLRSVVLPLETEISTLRSRSNTSEQRIKELEQILEEKEKERKKLLEEDEKLISECLTSPIESDLEQFDNEKKANDYFKKYIQLKKYLKKNETKFVDLEQANLKAIAQIYSILTTEQKMRLIPNRSKKIRLPSKPTTQESEEDELSIRQNEKILRIEELIASLTSPADDSISVDTNMSSTTSSSDKHSQTGITNNIIPVSATYAELLAMYEKEKLTCIEMETKFQQKAKEASKQIENLNQEMNNLSTIIDDLRKEYSKMQAQFQFQLDSLIKLNEELRNDLQQSEYRNEIFKNENLKLKVENKQFQGEQQMLLKEFDEQYHVPQNLDDAHRQLAHVRGELVRLYQVSQSLQRKYDQTSETLKQLQKSNYLQRNNQNDEHLVMMQSLESELERERKVRVETENDLKECKLQLKTIKDKSQQIVESFRHKSEVNETEIRKLKEDNLELNNQIQSLKKESKNSLSVQEDLVRLIQSLQIELNQTKQASEACASDGANGSSMIVVRCQHEDDFNECASCKSTLNVTKRKHRCKHCCKIFCAECCSKTVLSGPNLRPHKVCDSCHTLLDKDVKPSQSKSTAST